MQDHIHALHAQLDVLCVLKMQEISNVASARLLEVLNIICYWQHAQQVVELESTASLIRMENPFVTIAKHLAEIVSLLILALPVQLASSFTEVLHVLQIVLMDSILIV